MVYIYYSVRFRPCVSHSTRCTLDLRARVSCQIKLGPKDLRGVIRVKAANNKDWPLSRIHGLCQADRVRETCEQQIVMLENIVILYPEAGSKKQIQESSCKICLIVFPIVQRMIDP